MSRQSQYWRLSLWIWWNLSWTSVDCWTNKISLTQWICESNHSTVLCWLFTIFVKNVLCIFNCVFCDVRHQKDAFARHLSFRKIICSSVMLLFNRPKNSQIFQSYLEIFCLQQQPKLPPKMKEKSHSCNKKWKQNPPLSE